MYSSLMPHAVCWRQDPQLIWTMAITNAITFLSYLSICLTLLYLARKTGRAIARDWVFFLTGFAVSRASIMDASQDLMLPGESGCIINAKNFSHRSRRRDLAEPILQNLVVLFPLLVG